MVPVRDGAFAWVDGDHGGLTLLMDRLVEAASGPAGHEAVQDLLLLLVDASTDHFSSEQDLMRAVEAGKAAGLRYVYAGNLPGRLAEAENTYCPTCRALLVERTGFVIRRNRVTPTGACPDCGARIPGVW